MSLDQIHLRTATTADDRALAALDAEAWPPELWVVPPQPAAEPFFGPRRKPGDVLVAVSDGTILGYARLGRHLPVPANEHVLHFEALTVSPDARGRGVGSLLIGALVGEARSRGARKLGLRALSTNTRAIALYERAGFELEGRLRDEIRLPDGTFADDLWFALWLDSAHRANRPD
jgi:ribosomal protein S18 acetylase RimI-like enzyme